MSRRLPEISNTFVPSNSNLSFPEKVSLRRKSSKPVPCSNSPWKTRTAVRRGGLFPGSWGAEGAASPPFKEKANVLKGGEDSSSGRSLAMDALQAQLVMKSLGGRY